MLEWETQSAKQFYQSLTPIYLKLSWRAVMRSYTKQRLIGTIKKVYVSFYAQKVIQKNIKKDVLIKNINKIELNQNDYCYHAGTNKIKSEVYATGGRVLSFVCLSEDFSKSRARILDIIESLNWGGGFFRKDIGHKVINE